MKVRICRPLFVSLVALIAMVRGSSDVQAHSDCDSLAHCEISCDKGDTVACLDVGEMYAKGVAHAPDHKKALKFYKKACEQEDAKACFALADLYAQGWMFEVEANPAAASSAYKRGQRLMTAGCKGEDARDCNALGQSLIREIEEAGRDAVKPGQVLDALSTLQDACILGEFEACSYLSGKLYSYRPLYDEVSYSVAQKLNGLLRRQAVSLCKKTTPVARACVFAGKWVQDNHDAKQLADVACKAGLKEGCWIRDERIRRSRTRTTLISKKTIAETIQEACDSPDKAACGIMMTTIEGRGEDAIGKEGLVAILRAQEKQCMHGNGMLCLKFGEIILRRKDAPLGASGKRRAIAALTQECKLHDWNYECRLCQVDPTSRECQERHAWRLRNECVLSNNARQCQTLGTMFRSGKDIPKDSIRAARFFKLGCAGSLKNSCTNLREMCDPTSSERTNLDASTCRHSLIDSDLFYEAEWRYRKTGVASIQNIGDSSQSTTRPTLNSESSSNSGSDPSFALKRGSLNADLVVSVVLDRARRAALRLVVDELKNRGASGRLPAYLGDLLSQAALLLADSSTLRREKFQDLAMTATRAFVASNLIDTLYPSDEALMAHSVWKGMQLERSASASASAGTGQHRKRAFTTSLRVYLIDWTYYELGKQSLFAKTSKVAAQEPRCPFPAGRAHKICEYLSGDQGAQALASLLKIDQVLSGIRFAKMIRKHGGVDLRRLIEALNKSDMVASLSQTPGLNLDLWESNVQKLMARVALLSPRLSALRTIIDPNNYFVSDMVKGLDWPRLRSASLKVRLLLSDASFKNSLHRADRKFLLQCSDIILGVQSVSQGEIDPRIASLTSIFKTWTAQGSLATLDARVGRLQAKIPKLDAAAPLLQNIARLREYMGNNEASDLIVGELKLHALGDVQTLFKKALKNLQQLSNEIEAFPGASVGQFHFAQGAVVRLLSFFDLMDQVARGARLGQSLREVSDSVKLLGSIRRGRFTAPLFEMMEPILDALQTHRPMDADLLFDILSRVRLDSLITALDSSGSSVNPCLTDESSAKCWAIKVVHALQESIERQGQSIHIDGGKFATRLAAHGDDFKRRHKGGHFLHLTVGMGGLYSQSPPSASGGSSKNRVVPIIAEQIGLGWASPTFWGNRLTAKVGGYGSGLLYRAVIDSVESNAITLGAFAALDVYDLVELYVAPGVMIYPPVGDGDAGLKFGVSFGMQVPLGSYLERIGK